VKAIHQFVAGFAAGDAISNEALLLRALFRGWGYASEIYCERSAVSPALRGEARDAAEAPAALGAGDAALLHLSIGSPVNERFAALACRKAILYHNITPARYFRGFQEAVARDLALGREQARALAGAAEVVLADSRYNADDLRALGHESVRVLPLVWSPAAVSVRPDRAVLRRFRDGRATILFVGRCAPNKRLEDALSAFYYYVKTVDARARFIHVGSAAGLERYQALLQVTARNLGVAEAVEFAGSVSQPELAAYYRGADLFLCLSDHEGFCIPLLESMARDLPVLALARGAVPETLNGAGVLAHELRWDYLAEMMGQLVRPGPFRDAVLAGQRRRLAEYLARDLGSELKACLAPLLAE